MQGFQPAYGDEFESKYAALFTDNIGNVANSLAILQGIPGILSSS
jgi:hypothetical protein